MFDQQQLSVVTDSRVGVRRGAAPPPLSKEFHLTTQRAFPGYQLCDNSVGVLFNDYTRLIMYADGDSLQYIDKTAAESYLNVRTYPQTLNKKVSPEGGRARSPHSPRAPGVKH